MGADEKKLVKTIAEAASVLPEEGRAFILGYAEGVIAMAGSLRTTAEQASA